MTFRNLAASALALATLAGAPAHADDWKRVGTVVFDDPFIKTIVSIPKGMGPMSDVQFVVTGADIEIADLKITYGNGQVDDIAVRDVFKAGSASRAVPLKGFNGRNIKNITVVYRAHGKARFDVLGNVAAGSGKGGWVQLGCQPVGFRVDHDAITVGGQEGGFKALRLRVQGAPVEFYDVVAIFGNGQQQKLSVRAAIPAGGSTRQLDLNGQVRGIRRIDFLYRSIPTFTGQATVCADGLMAP